MGSKTMGDERWVNYFSITLISDNSALSKRKYTKFLTICLVGFIFCIVVSGASANTLEKLDVAEGDAIWYDLTVSEAGLVGINAWTEGISENDDILIYLYDPSGTEVTHKKGYYNQISIAQPVTITGTYKVKVYLEDSYDGGLGKVSVSSPLSMSASPRYIDTATDVPEGNAIWYDLTVSEAGVVGINAWTEGISENDDILIYLYDPSGTEVTHKKGYYNQISIAQPVVITGKYEIKVHLEDSYDGGLSKVFVSSFLPMSVISTSSELISTDSNSDIYVSSVESNVLSEPSVLVESEVISSTTSSFSDDSSSNDVEKISDNSEFQQVDEELADESVIERIETEPDNSSDDGKINLLFLLLMEAVL